MNDINKTIEFSKKSLTQSEQFENFVKMLGLTLPSEKDNWNVILQALEKQMPKKPKTKLRHRGGFVVVHCPECNRNFQADRRYAIPEDYCGVCGKLLDGSFDNFCGNCGQKVDWSDADEK